MKIHVRIRPGARHPTVEKLDETHYRVSVKEPPIDGRANEAVIETLATYFDLKPFQLNITSGHAGRNKIIEIPDTEK